MVFGKKNIFAIEAIVEGVEPVKNYRMGRICYWAKGASVGNFNTTDVLDLVADDLRLLASWKGQRSDPLFDGLGDRQILDLIEMSSWYGYEPSPEFVLPCEKDSLPEEFRNNCICPRFFPAFDAWLAVLIDIHQGERFIWLDRRTLALSSLDLPAGGYESVVEKFLAWFDSQP